MRSKHLKKSLALLLGLTLLAGSALSAAAAEPIGDGVESTCDEAYYGTMDYYGNLEEGGVVKSYVMNGKDTIIDYGDYEEVINLTDGTVPGVDGDRVRFAFEGERVPSHFYFEGKTKKPFESLPWDLSVHYTLNGVPTKAEDLAGEKGVVEILIDAIPNENASEYARYNYTLESMAIFNQDEILSLEAEGAQVQLLGNLRAVLFVALPGEEQHLRIRIGSESFSFGGMTFLMVPATLSQLAEISKLSEKKDRLEKDYDRLSGSLDVFLDSLGGISSSLYATAEGLDELEQARDIISKGKSSVYDAGDLLRKNADSITDVMGQLPEEIDAASLTIEKMDEAMEAAMEQAKDLKKEIENLEDAIEDLQDSGEDAAEVMDCLKNVQKDLNSLSQVLRYLKSEDIDNVEPLFGGRTGEELQEALDQAKSLHDVYEYAGSGDALDFTDFLTAVLMANGSSPSSARAQAGSLGELWSNFCDPEADAETIMQNIVNYFLYVAGATEEEAYAYAQNWAKANGMHDAWLAAGKGEELDFPGFVYGLLLIKYGSQNARQAAADAESLSELYTLNEACPEAVALLILEIDRLNEMVEGINDKIDEGNEAIDALLTPSISLVDTAAHVAGKNGKIEDMLEDMNDTGDVTRDLLQELRKLGTKLENVYDVLDSYEKDARKTLTTVKDLTGELSKTVTDAGAFYDSFAGLARSAGTPLDSGTEKTLKGLAAALRDTAGSLGTTGDIKRAKKDISDIIEEVWNDYTGDVNNLLLMDANAAAQSLTDSRNPAPTSLQVLLRTQEIKINEGETEDLAEENTDKGNIFSRIGAMFKDIGAAITGLFR